MYSFFLIVLLPSFKFYVVLASSRSSSLKPRFPASPPPPPQTHCILRVFYFPALFSFFLQTRPTFYTFILTSFFHRNVLFFFPSHLPFIHDFLPLCTSDMLFLASFLLAFYPSNHPPDPPKKIILLTIIMLS